jgi:hypothetical protein
MGWRGGCNGPIVIQVTPEELQRNRDALGPYSGQPQSACPDRGVGANHFTVDVRAGGSWHDEEAQRGREEEVEGLERPVAGGRR